MSVVAWDGKTLAADRMRTTGDIETTMRKLWKLKTGEIIAVIGYQAEGLALKRWYEDGAKREDWPKCQEGEDWVQFIVASEKGCFHYNNLPEQIESIDPFAAWGVGRRTALGAMAMGADAVKAVEIASKYASGCGKGCDFEMVQEGKIIKEAILVEEGVYTEWQQIKDTEFNDLEGMLMHMLEKLYKTRKKQEKH